MVNTLRKETGDSFSSGIPFLNNRYFHILLIALIGIIIYSNTFQVPFHYDDKRNITENLIIKDLSYFSDIS